MSRLEAEMLSGEAKSRGIYCQVCNSDGLYWIELGDRRTKRLSYWYAVMDLWELEYKKEGVL